MTSLRTFLAACAMLGMWCSSHASAQAQTVAAPYVLEDALPGLSFDMPLGIVSAPGDKTRFFVLEKPGRIQVVTGLDDGRPVKKVFLDLTQPRDGNFFGEGEAGVLGLAFPPDYATSRRCFVYYSLKVRFGKKLRLCQRLSLFPISPDDPNHADHAQEQPLITQLDLASNHNGGDLHFGPDGCLYVSVGDGGAGDDKYDNARFINKSFHAGILRIDVDKRPGSLPPNPHESINLNPDGLARYAIPKDNPFVGATSYHGETIDPATVRTEFWATGLRNPWRMSFDPPTGRLFAGEVGQNLYEEIDIIVKGGDYGWSNREATHPFVNGPGKDKEPADFKPVAPIYEYPHATGLSVTGGAVYHGERFPELKGAYIFADYAMGALTALREQNGTWKPEFLGREPGIAGIGVDPRDGEILFASISLGKIKRLKRSQASAGL